MIRLDRESRLVRDLIRAFLEWGAVIMNGDFDQFGHGSLVSPP